MNSPFRICTLPEWADNVQGRYFINALANADLTLRYEQPNGAEPGTFRYFADVGSGARRKLADLRLLSAMYEEATCAADDSAFMDHVRAGRGYHSPADAYLAKVRGEYRDLYAEADELAPVAPVRSAFGRGGKAVAA